VPSYFIQKLQNYPRNSKNSPPKNTKIKPSVKNAHSKAAQSNSILLNISLTASKIISAKLQNSAFI